MSCHRFGPFLLLASRRQLFEGTRQVKLGARALDLLAVLVARAGEVVSKQELMALVWPQEVVEDNTLRVHMAALRKALGAGDGDARYIANVAGRGYSLVVPAVSVAPPPLDELPTAPAPLDESAPAAVATGLPRAQASAFAGAVPSATPAAGSATASPASSSASLSASSSAASSSHALPRATAARTTAPRDDVSTALRGLAALSALAAEEGGALAPTPPGFQQLPRPSGPLLGREGTVDALDRQLSRYGFVTLVGPGGIGKTSVALAAARQLHPRYPNGLWFVDLATLPALASPMDVAFAVARALDLDRSIEGLFERLRLHLGAASVGERRLLILDNCEHVVKSVGQLVESLLAALPGLHLLLTSREPLRAVGEQVYLLPSLPMPGDPVPSMAEALHSPAVQLFVQRAQAADQTFDPCDTDAGWIIHICQGLDGVPLAIEHAAAMVRTFGLKALAASLDDRFLLLCGAHRNAISRHQNLQALLRWGYDLLSEPEQRLLRWLSVVRGPIALADILSFVAPATMDRQQVLEVVHSLVNKSWLFPRPGDTPGYRMHAMARSFAHQMLMEEQRQPLATAPLTQSGLSMLPSTLHRLAPAAPHPTLPSHLND